MHCLNISSWDVLCILPVYLGLHLFNEINIFITYNKKKIVLINNKHLTWSEEFLYRICMEKKHAQSSTEKKSSGENKNTSNARITRITIIDNYKTIGIQLHLNELTYSKVRRKKK